MSKHETFKTWQHWRNTKFATAVKKIQKVLVQDFPPFVPLPRRPKCCDTVALLFFFLCAIQEFKGKTNALALRHWSHASVVIAWHLNLGQTVRQGLCFEQLFAKGVEVECWRQQDQDLTNTLANTDFQHSLNKQTHILSSMTNYKYCNEVCLHDRLHGSMTQIHAVFPSILAIALWSGWRLQQLCSGEHSLFDIACGADPGCHEGSPNPLKNIDRLWLFSHVKSCLILQVLTMFNARNPIFWNAARPCPTDSHWFCARTQSQMPLRRCKMCTHQNSSVYIHKCIYMHLHW